MYKCFSLCGKFYLFRSTVSSLRPSFSAEEDDRPATKKYILQMQTVLKCCVKPRTSDVFAVSLESILMSCYWRQPYPPHHSESYIFIGAGFRLAVHYNMNVLFTHTASSLLFSSFWAIALLSGCTGELRPALHINQTVPSISDNNSSAQLRQYTCGTTTTVYVSKGYQVTGLLLHTFLVLQF